MAHSSACWVCLLLLVRSRLADAVACFPLTTPDPCQYEMGADCQAGLEAGLSCTISCISPPFQGTSTQAYCPSGNLAPSTQLTYTLPVCTLLCPLPPLMPVGYMVSLTNDPICAPGFIGIAVKTCSIQGIAGGCAVKALFEGCSYNWPSVAGDPVTYYGDVRKEFWLPVGVLTPLLRTSDLQVYASAFPGEGDDQWIDRVVVHSIANEEVAEVAIKGDIINFNRSASAPEAFETLNVMLPWWSAAPLRAMPDPDEYFMHWRGIHIAFARINTPGPLGLAPRRECVLLTGSATKVLITSSSAREYYGPWSPLAVKYSHLDMHILKLDNPDSARGVLPELWGLAPLSDETSAMIKEDKEEQEEGANASLQNAVVDGPVPTPIEAAGVVGGMYGRPARPADAADVGDLDGAMLEATLGALNAGAGARGASLLV